MPGSREEEIIIEAATFPRPAVFACVNLQNFKPFNTLLGNERGDRLLERAERRLGDLGRAWRTGGDEFIALVGGDLAEATERFRAFCWLLHALVGATEAWTFRFADGRRSFTVPWRSIEIVCAPRCGLAEIGPCISESLTLARRRCDDLRGAPPGGTQADSESVATRPWRIERLLAAAACPACGDPEPVVLEDDLRWSRESCRRCAASYERIDVLCALGEEA